MGPEPGVVTQVLQPGADGMEDDEVQGYREGGCDGETGVALQSLGETAASISSSSISSRHGQCGFTPTAGARCGGGTVDSSALVAGATHRDVVRAGRGGMGWVQAEEEVAQERQSPVYSGRGFTAT